MPSARGPAPRPPSDRSLFARITSFFRVFCGRSLPACSGEAKRGGARREKGPSEASGRAFAARCGTRCGGRAEPPSGRRLRWTVDRQAVDPGSAGATTSLRFFVNGARQRSYTACAVANSRLPGVRRAAQQPCRPPAHGFAKADAVPAPPGLVYADSSLTHSFSPCTTRLSRRIRTFAASN
jgi:hypothetical protein